MNQTSKIAPQPSRTLQESAKKASRMEQLTDGMLKKVGGGSYGQTSSTANTNKRSGS